MTNRLAQFLKAVDYRVTEGYEYMWHAYGNYAYALSSDGDGFSATIIFDTQTQEVYESDICDLTNQRAYRMINPKFAQAFRDEADSRKVDNNQAWEGVTYTDLEVEEDFIEKFKAIISGESYDTKVSVPMELEQDQLFELMRRAHEEDLTLNQYVEKILRNMIGSHGFQE